MKTTTDFLKLQNELNKKIVSGPTSDKEQFVLKTFKSVSYRYFPEEGEGQIERNESLSFYHSSSVAKPLLLLKDFKNRKSFNFLVQAGKNNQTPYYRLKADFPGGLEGPFLCTLSISLSFKDFSEDVEKNLSFEDYLDFRNNFPRFVDDLCSEFVP